MICLSSLPAQGTCLKSRDNFRIPTWTTCLCKISFLLLLQAPTNSLRVHYRVCCKARKNPEKVNLFEILSSSLWLNCCQRRLAAVWQFRVPVCQFLVVWLASALDAAQLRTRVSHGVRTPIFYAGFMLVPPAQWFHRHVKSAAEVGFSRHRQARKNNLP